MIVENNFLKQIIKSCSTVKAKFSTRLSCERVSLMFLLRQSTKKIQYNIRIVFKADYKV